MPKSIEAIISLFGTLLTGGIYVPLDPRWPQERILTTLADCAPRFMILDCSSDLVARIASGTAKSPETGPEPLIVNAHGGCLRWRDAVTGTARFSEPGVEPDDPALILFTSGSTGRPKGVTLSHRAVTAFVRWAAEEFRIGGGDRLACPSPLSFDLSTLDIYAMALRGAACVIVPEQVVWVPRFLTQFVAEHRISIWYSVPSILSVMLMDGGWQQLRFPELRVVAFAGEVLPGRKLEKLRSTIRRADFYNLYGPTETNVVSWYKVPDDFDPNQPIPIGTACPYAELVFDPADTEDGRTGKLGDLLVAGDSVMLGYWNRPEETKKAFVGIPDNEQGGKRFYRTGDRVMLEAASGNYIFVGRKDRQVKRRGLRIELGEIETALSRQPGVAEAAVVSSQDQKLQTVIGAFVRFEPDISVSQVELRTRCAQLLPSYMMPDRIIPIEFIPKGNRGKTDYAALAELLCRS